MNGQLYLHLYSGLLESIYRFNMFFCALTKQHISYLIYVFRYCCTYATWFHYFIQMFDPSTRNREALRHCWKIQVRNFYIFIWLDRIIQARVLFQSPEVNFLFLAVLLPECVLTFFTPWPFLSFKNNIPTF